MAAPRIGRPAMILRPGRAVVIHLFGILNKMEASTVGLRGPVHTFLTEEFTDEIGTSRESNGSAFDVYDRQGYQLEVYRYKPDGSL